MIDNLISIVVPVYNAEKFLKETIGTVKNQTYHNWELIFVDDCSKDKSVEVIKREEKKDERIKFYKLNENSGAASARNYGIEKSKGRYLCFLDADDLWENTKLEKQILFMKEKKCAFSYTSYIFADREGNTSNKKVIARSKLTYSEALKDNIISTITVMFDLTQIDKNLIKMPKLKYVEDTATWWRVLRNGYIAYGIDDVYSYYRRLPNTNSSNKLRTQKSLWNLYKNIEGLNFFRTVHCLFWKNLHAILRRI